MTMLKIIFLFLFFPLLVIWLLIRLKLYVDLGPTNKYEEYAFGEVRKIQRKEALGKAKGYIVQQSDENIFNNITLYNEHCVGTLYEDKIIFLNKSTKDKFVAQEFNLVDLDICWNALCYEFNDETDYQLVLNACKWAASFVTEYQEED